MYMKSKKLNEKAMKDVQEIDRIQNFLFQNKIKVVKLNNIMDPRSQRFSQFNSYFQLTSDFKYLEIINKKPID